MVESTGNMWHKTYEAFESCDIKMKLANPIKTRAIAEARIKTDKLDSKILAHLLRSDLIADCYMPPKEIRLQRTLLGHRATISREQTKVENRIYALLDKYDLKCPYETKMFGVHGMKWLHSLKLNGQDQKVFESLVRQLDFLKEEETGANAEIASEAIQSKYAPRIMSMTGFDYYSASMMSACIADITRFPANEYSCSPVIQPHIADIYHEVLPRTETPVKLNCYHRLVSRCFGRSDQLLYFPGCQELWLPSLVCFDRLFEPSHLLRERGFLIDVPVSQKLVEALEDHDVIGRGFCTVPLFIQPA